MCRVCLEPCQSNDAMRRRCCERGIVHLACIEDSHLQRCPGCDKDPMEGLLNKLEPCTLQPLDATVKPCVLRQAMLPTGFSCGQVDEGQFPVPTTVEILDIWQTMITREVHEAAKDWTEQIEVTNLSVGITLLNGRHDWCLKGLKDALKKAQDVESRVFDSLERWTRRRLGVDLDQIVEFTIVFRCRQWTHHYIVGSDPDKPFDLFPLVQNLGVWNCVISLCGFNMPFDGRPLAKRITYKERKRTE